MIKIRSLVLVALLVFPFAETALAIHYGDKEKQDVLADRDFYDVEMFVKRHTIKSGWDPNNKFSTNYGTAILCKTAQDVVRYSYQNSKSTISEDNLPGSTRKDVVGGECKIIKRAWIVFLEGEPMTTAGKYNFVPVFTIINYRRAQPGDWLQGEGSTDMAVTIGFAFWVRAEKPI